jgi:hypothetical protein
MCCNHRPVGPIGNLSHHDYGIPGRPSWYYVTSMMLAQITAFHALMRIPMPRLAVARYAALMLTAFTIPAFAALGEYESSVASDAIVVKMALRPVNTADARFRLHAMHDQVRGIRVREYASSKDGRIFGVAWDGPVKPDLRQLLGPQYFERYVKATQGVGKVRGVREINQGGFVLRVSGHMRHLVGAAWVPALVPEGMDPAEIQ